MNKLIIAKPGFDASVETNPDNLIFSSDYNTLKYFMSGNDSLSINGNGSLQYAEKVIAHNLGYIPFFVCFINNGSEYFLAPRIESTIAPNTTLHANAYADATNLYLTLKIDWASPQVASINYAYKIFKNNLGL